MSKLNLSAMNDFLGASVSVDSKASFTKFTQAGKWFIGMEMLEVTPEDQWIVQLQSLKHGYIGWENSKPDPQMRPISDPAVNINSLRTIPEGDGNGWFKALSFEAIHNEEDLEILVSMSSQGGVRAIHKLIHEIGSSAEIETDQSPVITLSGSSYYNSRFGKDIYYPVFTIVGWV